MIIIDQEIIQYNKYGYEWHINVTLKTTKNGFWKNDLKQFCHARHVTVP